MKKYRFFTFLILFALVFSLCACEGKKYDPEKDGNLVESSAVSNESDGSIDTQSEEESMVSDAEDASDDMSEDDAALGESSSTENESSVGENDESSFDEVSMIEEQSAEDEASTPIEESEAPVVHTHSYSEKVTKPTCTSDGYTVHTCKGCGDSFTDTYVKSNGHAWGDWKTVTEATQTAQGKEESTCTVCGEVQARPIAKLPMSVDEQCQEVMRLVNVEREKTGVAPLKYYYNGQAAADIRADEISQVFSHTRPNGESCFTVLEDYNYWAAGENIAYGYTTPEEVMNGWMNSDGHRSNILNPDYNCLIVGVKDGYWVQLFMYID